MWTASPEQIEKIAWEVLSTPFYDFPINTKTKFYAYSIPERLRAESNFHMSTTAQAFEAGVLNAIATAIQQNPGVLGGLITSGEADAEAGLTNLWKNLPSVKGAAGLIIGPLETAVETQVNNFVKDFIAAHGATVIEGLLVSLLQTEAKNLGG